MPKLYAEGYLKADGLFTRVRVTNSKKTSEDTKGSLRLMRGLEET